MDGIEVPVTPRRRSSGSGKKSKKKKQGTLSKEWRQLRKEHLMVYPECRVCGSTQRQVVHHLRYRPGGYGNSERPGDLVTLCEFHHNDFHKRLGRSGTGVQETIQYIKRESVAFEVDEMADSMFGHKF